MGHGVSAADREARRRFEAGAVAPGDFSHREHLRLAYTVLAEHDVETASAKIREAILRFLATHDVDPAKFHETLTRAWVLAVRHFMDRTPGTRSADEWLDANPRILDSRIMLSHYSEDRLNSDRARRAFLEPDLAPIPEPE